MSKPPSGLFYGTIGANTFAKGYTDIFSQKISSAIPELDTREHPLSQSALSTSQKKTISEKIKNRTATADEYRHYMHDKRFSKRRRKGVKEFWDQEAERLKRGEPGTRAWSQKQIRDIINGKKPKYNGRSIQGHHSYSASKYPHLANLGELIFPATAKEHLSGWHGGNYQKSLPGRPIKLVREF